jgi:hypothetical protein
MNENNIDEELLVEEQQISKFSSASAQLARIDDLFKAAHIYCLDADYKKWRFTCDRVWMELAAEATEEQKQYQADILNRLTQTYSKYKTLTKEEFHKLNAREQEAYKITEAKMLSNRDAVLYYIISTYEIFLRDVLNLQGKGSVYKSINYGEIQE